MTPSTWLSGVIGFLIGALITASMAERYDKQVVKAGYVVVGDKAYRIVPVEQ